MPKATLLALGVLGALSSVRSAEIALVSNGKPRATIVVADDKDPGLQRAATDLSHYVKAITGVGLPIKYEGQLTGIFVLDDQKIARYRLVRTGKIVGDRVEILSGLKPGQRYVMTVGPTLRNGVKVEEPS